jgi:hypothetical protein
MPKGPGGYVNLGWLMNVIHVDSSLDPGSVLTMQSGFALVINGMENLPHLDGAIVELTVCGPGMLGADIRIPGKPVDEPVIVEPAHGSAR